MAGVRDLEPYQRETLGASELIVVPGAIEAAAFENALRELRSRASRVYLHVDMDVIDVSEARANGYAAPGGPSVDRLLRCIARIRERFDIAAAAITAYDPAFDPDHQTLVAARRIATEIAAI